MSKRPEQEALQVSLLLCALCAPPLSCSRQQHEALWCDHGVPEGGRILYGLYMDEASTAASTEANTRVRRCMACASSQRAREDELGKVDAQGPSITSVTALDM